LEIKSGKLPASLLKQLLDEISQEDPRVLLGPKVGEDAALIDFGDRVLAAKTDPITFATDLIGWYLVQVNVNDLAVMGATPKWMMVTLLLPEGIEERQIKHVFNTLAEATEKQGITLIGGHTEITAGLSKSIAVGTLLGELDKKDIIMTSGMKEGDSIILTKGIAIEGTAILCRESEKELSAAGVPKKIIESGKNMLFKPGLSVRKDAELARKTVRVHAMHDPTEGGLVNGLLEMSLASGLGIKIKFSEINIFAESKIVCDALGLNPLGLIASGALLAAVSPSDASKLMDVFHNNNIDAKVIGTATKLKQKLYIENDGKIDKIPMFERDELARYYSG